MMKQQQEIVQYLQMRQNKRFKHQQADDDPADDDDAAAGDNAEAADEATPILNTNSPTSNAAEHGTDAEAPEQMKQHHIKNSDE